MQQVTDMENQVNELRDWLRRCTEVTGWPLTRLAKEAGLSPSTVTRFVGGKVDSLLSTSSQSKIRAAAKRRIAERAKAGEIVADDALRVLGIGRHSSTGIARVPVLNPRVKSNQTLAESPAWDFPEGWFRSEFGASPSDCVILPNVSQVAGLGLPAGGNLVVDTTVSESCRPGLFVIEDGFERLPARLVQGEGDDDVLVDTGTGPVKSKRSGLKIVGRVVGSWGRV